MHTYTLQPTDIVFFRDGRPMSGSQSGHGAAWPMPHTLNAAWHAALHRSNLGGTAHRHRLARSGKILSENRDTEGRLFGSLFTAGPFPVNTENNAWLFPTPADLNHSEAGIPTLLPLNTVDSKIGKGSLPAPLSFPLVNTHEASKEKGKPWIPTEQWQQYIQDEAIDVNKQVEDGKIHDTESYIGIGIDPETGTQDKESFYSAHYMRLRDSWRLGCVALCEEKDNQDLLEQLFPDQGTILIGGQQRVCRVERQQADLLPLPKGLSNGFKAVQLQGKTCYAVKWVLLTPAIWPKIQSGGNPHPGGWLPGWICPQSGKVFLKAGDTRRKPGTSREIWRKQVRALPAIQARLVSALVPKPQVVTGFSLLGKDTGDQGAKSTHLAVPAGAVYYFLTENEEDATSLAHTLNWHGESNGQSILNRRSTLCGEKGFGLGACGTWYFHEPL